ncbi:MAG: PIN domain-containing protein [Phycisphaerae bacterium]|nr:PIN domain-containing protein [Phycisphaerae bacterium]
MARGRGRFHSRGRLFAACDRGDVVLEVLPSVLAECVFVLDSFYGHPRGAIAAALTGLITSPGVEIRDQPAAVDALGRYARTRCHFVDCLIAAAAAAGDTPVATFDEGFRKFEDVRVKID